ncbi:Bug family tripartite tricarboxylate transporter substrate binding protein [Bordetella pertussis]|uniref:Bug family tripartite tricarboxylate transporter substrate binding protein n=1 Tax=Bordetella pertussis TaxID=520 RepID=UPI0006DC8708|nr:tripartite tricarboxylate transporter substrate binding protein [Bordetella pertussis]
MAMKRREMLSLCGKSVIALGCGGLPAILRAQGRFPSKALTYVVAYTPGSANDILVRILAPELGTQLGQSIIVDNKPGAGGSIGMAAVAQSKADGYTLGLGSTATMAINRALYKNLPYDPLRDFESVVKFASTANVLVVPAGGPAKTLADLKPRDGKSLMFSSPGNGTTQHLAGVLFSSTTKLPTEHVPYRGPAESVMAVASGEVDFSLASLPSALAQIRAGRLRVLGCPSLKPPSSLPQAVSLAEQGLPGFERTEVWFGLVVPSGTPDQARLALEQASVQVLGKQDVREKLEQAGYQPANPQSEGKFDPFVREQVAFWADLVKQAGASID